MGASTGGFTDCLLQRGAAGVIAVDVGYGQLDWGLRNDPRVNRARAHQRTRTDRSSCCHTRRIWRRIDVSFISLAKVLPAVLGCMAESL